jgi:hypothetical protein
MCLFPFWIARPTPRYPEGLDQFVETVLSNGASPRTTSAQAQ